MNERIKELAEQAFFDESTSRPSTKMYTFSDHKMEKFAELIINECVNRITSYDLVPGHSAKWEDIYDIHTRLLQDLGEELKEHFGVEL